MRRPALYSSSSRAPRGPVQDEAASTSPTGGAPAAATSVPAVAASAQAPPPRRRLLRDPRLLWSCIALLTAALLVGGTWGLRPQARNITQEDIDHAVMRTLSTNVLPSQAARAYGTIIPSVVRVMGFVRSKDGKEDVEQGVGSGVVIVDKGVILTNLHVVSGAQTIKVTFADGLESTASVTGTQPENDLAVLQAHKIPDDLSAATMRSTSDLGPGDEVLAVGFPFGIGPSASAGIVSGLGRTFRSPEGKHEMTNLIQFDAAANPGNSGGRWSPWTARWSASSPPSSTPRSSAPSSASASPCRSRTPPPPSACILSEPPPSTPPGSSSMSDSSPASADTAQLMEKILYEVKRVVVGQDRFLERVMVAMLAQGHLLVEGVPGLAKTLTIKTLADTVHGRFKRIQFTPDLVPADLVGTRIYNQKTGDFSTSLGPVFTNLLLADEINRAPAKVQSALLEVMQERQVTIAGETHKVPSPFLVMATQNPIETEGTYPLPEAQVDRFMMKVLVDYPTDEEEFVIVQRVTGPVVQATQVATTEQLAALQKECRLVYVDPSLVQYAVKLVSATRKPAVHGLKDLARFITFGASPRATINLVEGARALAMLRGRTYALPEDMSDLVPDVLRHRLVLSYEALSEGMDADAVVGKVMAKVPPPPKPLEHEKLAA